MSRIPLIDVHAITDERQVILKQINGAFGTVPNMFKVVAQSGPALKSMWGSFGALSRGTLSAKLGEKIAVAVANYNKCEYCLAAHTALGENAGVDAKEMAEAQLGLSDDPKTAAALQFALLLVKKRGQVSADDVQAVRNAGFSDEEIVEILAHVSLNLFTNYTNVAFNTPIDFPRVDLI